MKSPWGRDTSADGRTGQLLGTAPKTAPPSIAQGRIAGVSPNDTALLLLGRPVGRWPEWFA
jgi:hypothetical protein